MERVSEVLNKIRNIQVEKVVTLFIQVILQFLLMIENIAEDLVEGMDMVVVVVVMGLDTVVDIVVVMEVAMIVIEIIDDVAVVREVLDDIEMIDMGRKVGIEGGNLKKKTSLVVYQ